MDDTSIRTNGREVERVAQRRLATTGYHSLKAIECLYQNNTLYLHGQVPTYYQKQLAQESTRALQGVDRVVNEIDVSSGHGQAMASYRSIDELRSEIRHRS